MMLYEDICLRALSSMNSDEYDEKTWLINHLELFKKTLVWPVDLPPLNRFDMKEGTLLKKFNETYKEILAEYEHEFNNNTRTITIK